MRKGEPIVIVDNAGGDEFGALSPRNIATDPDFWVKEGFSVDVVDTVFEFSSQADADRLITRYFGPPNQPIPTTLSYRVYVFVGASLGESDLRSA